MYDILRESKMVIDNIKENDFTVLLKLGKNYAITVYVPKKTILKEMATKIMLSQHFFSDLVQNSPIAPHM
jgi:hypothetical protein